MAPTPVEHDGQVLAHAPMERSDLAASELACRMRGCDPRVPQHLVDAQVPETGDHVLIQQQRLDRTRTAADRDPELVVRDLEKVGSQSRDVGVERDARPSPRIVHAHRAAIGQRDPETVPPGFVPTAAVLELVDRGNVVHHDPAGHPEVDAERGTVGVEQELFAETAGRQHRASSQLVVDAIEHTGCGNTFVHLDPSDLTTDQRLRRTTVDLDLESLRHRSSVADATRTGHTRQGMELLGLLLTIAIGGLIIWLAFRIEPHWVSKDGRRFICRAQLIDDRGNVHGRWNEYRFRVTPDGLVAGARRSMFSHGGGDGWAVVARSEDAPPRKAVYLLQDPVESRNMIAIRLPRTSRAVDVLDDLLNS